MLQGDRQEQAGRRELQEEILRKNQRKAEIKYPETEMKILDGLLSRPDTMRKESMNPEAGQ